MATAFPPHKSLPSQSIPAETALSHLQTYLAATKSFPYLLPNARLEPSGPSAGSSNSSVTIHNLQRVEAGLRGEWLAPVLDLEEAVPVATGRSLNVDVADQGKEEEGWQDLEEYQREQSDLEGEINPRSTALDLEAVEDEVPDAVETAPQDTKSSKKPQDKEARKLAKKSKMKEERRRKGEEQRLAAAEAALEA